MPAIAIAGYFYNKIAYFTDEDRLFVKIGFIYHKIDIDKITSLTKINTINMAKNKVEIEYEGGSTFLYLRNPQKFIDHLLFLNPAILIN